MARQSQYSTLQYDFTSNGTNISAKEDRNNCGVALIGGLNVNNIRDFKKCLNQLKRHINLVRFENNTNHLHSRKILIGTINTWQKTTYGTKLKSLGFRIGQQFTNLNSTNKCYVVTANIDKLKI